jgi:hypothetical protein
MVCIVETTAFRCPVSFDSPGRPPLRAKRRSLDGSMFGVPNGESGPVDQSARERLARQALGLKNFVPATFYFWIGHH